MIKCVKHGSLALHPLGKMRKGSAHGVRGIEIRERNRVWRNVCEIAEMNDKEAQRVVGGRGEGRNRMGVRKGEGILLYFKDTLK